MGLNLGSGLQISFSPAGSSGQFQFNNSGAFAGAAELLRTAPGSGQAITITSQNANDFALLVKGASGQSAHILEVQTSGGAELAYVTAAGSAFFNTLSCNNVNIAQAPTGVSSASAVGITSGADGAANIGHRISIAFNGTTYWIPASTVAF